MSKRVANRYNIFYISRLLSYIISKLYKLRYNLFNKLSRYLSDVYSSRYYLILSRYLIESKLFYLLYYFIY